MAIKVFRRWFRIRFSLRAFLTVVTLAGTACGGYIASQASIVRQRKAMMQKITRDGGQVGGCTFGLATILGFDHQVPWLRRKLGDVYVDQIVVPVGPDEVGSDGRPSEKKVDEVQRTFPEASLIYSTK